ncbi:MAG: DUF937 domain-containing protein [Bauldia sp.]|nr:DUF937 domain-containing protein [Bauldia sp.]
MASGRMIALLGLLAVAGYQNRDRLGQFFNRATNQGAGTGESSGGLFDSLRDLWGGRDVDPDTPGDQPGGIGGFLSNLFGGGDQPGQGLSGGLRDLVEKFTGNGHGEEARSWIESGSNSAMDERSLEEALGEDTIQELTAKTGLDRAELLQRLQTVLPQAIDQLTPDGRLPTDAEVARIAGSGAAPHPRPM